MSVTHRVTTASAATAFAYTSAAFTPAVGDLLVAYTAFNREPAGDNPTMTDSAGGAWTNVGTVAWGDPGQRHQMRTWIRNTLIASATSMTVTFDDGGSATYNCTACVIAVASVTGATKVGGAARRSGYTGATNGGVTPGVSFNSDAVTPTLATSVCFVGIVNGTNPPALTPPTGYTELDDTGTTAIGFEYAVRESGQVAVNVAWIGTSATQSGQLSLEVDMTSGTAFAIQAQTRTYATSLKIANLFTTAAPSGGGGGGGARQIAGGPMNFKHRVAFKRPFLLVLSSDGRTGATGKTPVVTISKNGAAFASPAAGATVTELTNGWYVLNAVLADADTPGALAIHITATAANTEDYLDFIEDDGIWRSKVTGATTNVSLIDSALVQSAANTWKGRVIIAMTGVADGQASNIDGFDPATDKITFTAMPSTMAVGDEYWIV